MVRVLVVEDEEDIRDFLIINLKRAGYESIEVGTGEEAIELLGRDAAFRVVLLDIMLPGMDGFKVLKRIRERNPSVGVIMLSARGQEFDKVNGLSLGADDYVVKPFSPSELIARIDALVRRLSVQSTDTSMILESYQFKLDLSSRRFYKGDMEIELTQVEFSLVKFFLENQHKALSRDEILNAVWGRNYFGDWKTVDVNISRIRQKLEDNPSVPVYLNTVRGFGYRWGKDN
ncbi:MAG TPA: response regulator transcription factor [Clostridia bacterium]